MPSDSNKFNFKKRFGQNFLTDNNLINKIVCSSSIDRDTVVIEVGVGSGNLTKKLAEAAKYVIGYEIDTELKPILKTLQNEHDNVNIIYDDFLNRNIYDDLYGLSYDKLYVVANLPYYITTPIITKLIEDKVKIDKMVIMVQKEVGDRLNAKPGSRDYNSLTVFINYFFEVKKLFDVSRNVFIPKPNVDSSVLQLSRREKKINVINEDLFFRLVKDAFKYKRKNLRNNLKGYDLDKITLVLSKYNLDLTVRAEQLSIEQFADIANNL